jgi:hypothetical protein
MKTPKQWLEDMEARPCVTRNDLLVIIKQIQEDAIKSQNGQPEFLSQAFNEGDGVYRP